MPKSRRLLDDSFNIEWINRLIKKEQEDIESYKDAISECKDANVLEVYTHILQEKIEHVEELNKLKEDLLEPVKDSRFRDSKDVKYIVVVNGERYASFDNEDDAIRCENSFYDMDADAESYYGLYPDVRIIKEDAYGRRIRDSKVKKIKYGKPTNYINKYYSVEGSEEGEIYDNINYLAEARSKIRDLKRSDKEYGIDQDYIVYRHYITENEDYIEEV